MSTIPPEDDGSGRRPAMLSVEQQRAILQHRIAQAATWWYWIAGLTAVNTGAFFFHSTWGFALGTGAVDLVNAIVGANPRFTVAGIVIDAVVIGLIALWGLLCTRGRLWAFWTGMILYGLDTILVAVLHQWISAAFHAYVIYRMYAGVASVNLLRKLETAVAAQRSYYHARPDAPAAGNAQAGGPWYSGASTRVELDAPDAARPKSDSGSGQE